MKTGELKKIAAENEYELTKSLGNYKLVRRTKSVNHYINIGNVCANSLWISIEVWCDEKDFNMIKAAVEFAETPIEDREEEKKFYLKHRYLRSIGGSVQYFTIHTSFNFPFLSYIQFSGTTKQQFTREEIEKIKDKFDTDLADFKEVEV